VRLTGDGEAVRSLRRTGERVLASLVENYVVIDKDDDRHGMVTETCYNRPGEYVTENEVVWTDYYVAAALDAVVGRDGPGS
jgi:unsaturated chondroitin disaccharide hydrolase